MNTGTVKSIFIVPGYEYKTDPLNVKNSMNSHNLVELIIAPYFFDVYMRLKYFSRLENVFGGREKWVAPNITNFLFFGSWQ